MEPFESARLGPIVLRNRIIKAATFEGLSPRGTVSEDLVRFHRTIAEGGVGMTTLAYCAVAPEGRTDRHQIVLQRNAIGPLRRLTSAVHEAGALVSVQLGHAGPVADGRSNGVRSLAPHRRFSPLSLQWGARASVADLKRIVRAYGSAARCAVDAGFDAVEVHLGHHYLASAFLSRRLNHRRDCYGGSLAARARLAREILMSVGAAVDGRLAVIAKLNLEDGVRGGLELAESVQVAQWLESDGALDAVEMTAGSSLLNPMYLFKGPAPLREFAAAMRQPVRAGVRLFGRTRLHSYPYEDGYLLEDSLAVRSAVNLPMILLGGVTGRAVIDRALSSGFEFVAMGRALLREPGLPNRMRADASVRSTCTHCNRCMPTIYSGTRCVLV